MPYYVTKSTGIRDYVKFRAGRIDCAMVRLRVMTSEA
jgi:hypothetical protein